MWRYCALYCVVLYKERLWEGKALPTSLRRDELKVRWWDLSVWPGKRAWCKHKAAALQQESCSRIDEENMAALLRHCQARFPLYPTSNDHRHLPPSVQSSKSSTAICSSSRTGSHGLAGRLPGKRHSCSWRRPWLRRRRTPGCRRSTRRWWRNRLLRSCNVSRPVLESDIFRGLRAVEGALTRF